MVPSSSIAYVGAADNSLLDTSPAIRWSVIDNLDLTVPHFMVKRFVFRQLGLQIAAVST